MSANYAKLRGKIREVFGTQEAFAEAMDMNVTTVSIKLNGKSDWTRSEIAKSCNLLRIPVAEAYAYFFTV